ncbi:hypothetical protein [Rubellimicrobium roseum]|uniref:Sulfotransferase n=1 Tax=Rubellimicrobium roseum TaxID=687525 RepID=A0A5C4NLC3_9RHOB|nr:hypothetical protein [Rubellimicrobium roseum]TNC74790.1 hypothetical protein FHG71_01265 [Rubellimicrobium roseum]
MQNLLFQPVHGYRQILTHREVFEGLLRPHGLQFDPEAIREAIAARQHDVPPGMVPVISSELISGNPFFGGRENDLYAERMRQTMPDARVLISIRTQLRILPSVYMQYIRRGGTMTPERFFDGEVEWGYFGFAPEHFEYDRLIALYQELFGRDNVYVLPQEMLQADLDLACADLARFAGHAEWRGLSSDARRVRGASDPEYAVPVLRRVNHVRPSALHHEPLLNLGTGGDHLFRATSYLMRRAFVAALMKSRTPVSQHVRARFAGYFSESNARLRRIVSNSIDMSAYT